MWLRQSTASQEILLGPFLDSTNGNDQETALTINNTDIQLWKEGATTETSKNSGGATHIANGRYYAVLDATDTNTLGKLEVNVHVTGALAVRREFMVVPAMIYDSIILGTDRLDTNVTHVGDTAQTANDNGADLNTLVTRVPNTLNTTASGNIGIDWANVENPTTVLDLSGTDINLVDTCTTNTDMRGTDSALLAASAPTNFGDLAITITTGEVTVGTNNDKTGYTASTVSDKTGYSISGTKTTLDALNDIAATDVVSGGAITTSGGAVSNVTTTATATALGADAVDSTSLATTAVDEIRDGLLPTQNAVFNNIMFLFVAASDHVTPVTGATGTAVTRSIDGGAFGAATGTLAEVANGIYQFDASAADMNGGVITFRFTATGGTPGAPDDRFVTIITGGGV